MQLCERCFASVPAEISECPECGAQLKAGSESQDSGIYPELARANLFRMRGDYRSAEDQCLRILKRFPNNATAHTLMGDLYVDQNRLEQAIEWYELALDLDPLSPSVRSKLTSAQKRLTEHEFQAGAEQLGLHPSRASAGALAIGALALFLLVGLLAYYIGSRGQGLATAKPSASGRSIEAPMADERGDQVALPVTTEAPASVAGRDPQADRELEALLRQRSSYGGAILGVTTDPRSRISTITFALGAGEDERRIGAEVAKTALEQNAEALIITLRAIENDRIVWMADVPRSRVQETETTAWQQSASGPDAWISHVLTNEWPKVPAPAPAVTAPAPNGAGTTPGGPPGAE